MFRIQSRHYAECIEAAAKLDLITSMVEAMEDINDEIITDEKYVVILEVQNTLSALADDMRKESKLYITLGD